MIHIRYIITYFPEFIKTALQEAVNCGAEKTREFSKSIYMIESNAADFLDKLIQSKPVFIRHIMPVVAEGLAGGQKEIDCAAVLESAKTICHIGEGDSFSVQTRILNGDADYSSKDVEVFVGSYFDSLGGMPVFSDTAILNEGAQLKIISVFIFENKYYIGFSTAQENMHWHCDEYRILSRHGREISRAENKLKEAIGKFNIKIKGEGYALDMGASPGGWTKVLADYGYMVYAVDPGNLNPLLMDNPRIKHFKSRIENVEFENKFEIIVNDMNIDPQLTSNIMCELAPRLIDGGTVVVTLKLPFADVARSIAESAAILEKEYDVLEIKNLSHNRREVTVLAQKKA